VATLDINESLTDALPFLGRAKWQKKEGKKESLTTNPHVIKMLSFRQQIIFQFVSHFLNFLKPQVIPMSQRRKSHELMIHERT